MKDPHLVETPHGAGIGTYKSYGLGFFLCLVLTFAAYFSVEKRLFDTTTLVWIATLFGALQIFIQLILFIHLNGEEKPRWNTIVFLFMLLISLIVVVGSIWIMANLDYRVMSTM